MRVACEIEEVELEGDYSPVPGVCVTCGKCGHQVEVFGDSDASVRRGTVMLREECPRGESNFYAPADADAD